MVKQFRKREFKETSIEKPKETFKLEDFSKKIESKKQVGRPKKNKIYGTLRIQKHNVNAVNAIQNTLGFETQDDIVEAMVERMQNSLTPDEKTMFDMYMRTYTKRDKNKKA